MFFRKKKILVFEIYGLPLDQIYFIQNTIGYCQIAKSVLKT